MPNTFFIGDTHFGHNNIIKWDENRKHFSSIEEHDEYIVECWNSVVNHNDNVYHLGDVVIPRKSLYILDRLKGKKRLIMGNHDIYPHKDYLKYFYRIGGCKSLKFKDDTKFILTHIPIHPMCVEHRWACNIHGHQHKGELIGNKKYFNVCCHFIDFTPISLDEIRSMVK